MRNEYYIENDVVHIKLQNKKGEVHYTLIDLDDFVLQKYNLLYDCVTLRGGNYNYYFFLSINT
jgi:hypothetical protein